MLREADYLDLADSFLGLGHTDRLGRIFIGQDLSAAKVVSGKDDPIYKIFWFTGTWDFPAEQTALINNSTNDGLRIVWDNYRLRSSGTQQLAESP